MAIRLTPQDLQRAVSAGILQPGQDRALLDFMANQPDAQPSFQLSHIAYYSGAVLIIAAMGWLMNEAWDRIGNPALLSVSALYMLAFTLCGFSLYKRGLPIPGGLLGAVAVSLTPLFVFALQGLLGAWPMDDAQSTYTNYYLYVHGGWLWMEAATLLAGVLMLRLIPFPFIVLPMAIALWFMSMDLCGLFQDDYLGWESRETVSFWFGLVVLLATLLLDGRSQRDYAFWGYLAGLLAFWGGMSLMDSDSLWGKHLYCLINLGLMSCAVLLRRPMFMVFGSLGVAGYLGYLSYHVFRDSLGFPIVLTLIGLAIIALGVSYQKHREILTGRLRRHLPAGLVNYLPALRN